MKRSQKLLKSKNRKKKTINKGLKEIIDNERKVKERAIIDKKQSSKVRG